MKANDIERKKFDEALDVILELFNNLEGDTPFIQFSDEAIELIQKAKIKYGQEKIDSKINTILMEMLSLLDLDDVEIEETEESGAVEVDGEEE